MSLITKQPFGEVIASTIQRCTIQAWEWDSYPTPGSLVIIEEPAMAIAALVQTIETMPLDAARMPTAYKKDLATLKAEHPHLFLLLRTTINSIPVGVLGRSAQPIDRPALLHSFCRLATQEELVQIISDAGYIKKLLLQSEPTEADILIEQHLRYLAAHKSLNQETLRAIVGIYIATAGSDYKRILNFNVMIQKQEC